MYTTIRTKLEAIQALPICELNKRQPMLVDLMALIVNYETDNGRLTEAKGNWGLESQDYWATLGAMTRDAGFKRLGNGHFSAAYSHDLLPGKVIKVGFKKEDSGAAYVAFCRMHQGREGIPVIHDVQRHLGCYTVVMDQLTDLDSYDDEDTRFENVEADYESLGAAVYCSDVNWKSHLEYVKEYDLQRCAGLYETARLIHKFFYGIASFDMHRGNVMVDPRTGKLVITDPVSFTHEDSPITKCDAIDPEALLAEIEVMAQQARIENCKRRKRLRDPESTGRMRRKLRNANKRSHAKRMAKREAQQLAQHKERIGKAQALALHELRFGLHAQNNLFREHSIAEMDRIVAEMNAVHVLQDCWRIPQGLPLAIDEQLQAGLMG